MQAFDEIKKNVVHIGMHKTGTSYLQKEVFPLTTSHHFVRGKSTLRAFYHPEVTTKPIFLSDEILSGHPFRESTLQDFESKCLAVKFYYSDPVILVAFRNPEEYIPSLYKQYLQEGGTLEIEEFYNESEKGVLQKSDLNFIHRLEFLQANFSKVISWDYLAFKRDFQSFIRRLSDLSGLEFGQSEFPKGRRNQSISTFLQKNALIKLNKLNRSMGGRLDRGIYKKLGLRPRAIGQGRLAGLKSPKWEPPAEFKADLKALYHEDWKVFREKLSIQ